MKSFIEKVKSSGGQSYLVNAFDADGLPCHFEIKCKDYMFAKMLKESSKAGCSVFDFGEVVKSGFGHLEN